MLQISLFQYVPQKLFQLFPMITTFRFERIRFVVPDLVNQWCTLPSPISGHLAHQPVLFGHQKGKQNNENSQGG
ncbi:hypothetical protein KCP74_06020 [Salmonella enterica subsp. enterica]|nr:hypothetical protein KCP74_06020 [Salmonella enterica subsp. enterica]